MFNLQQKIDTLVDMVHQIYLGYSNWLNFKLGRLPEVQVLKHDIKAKLCTKECPLRGRYLGVQVCDINKTYTGRRGCGCVIEAKLWSDSLCPLNKF